MKGKFCLFFFSTFLCYSCTKSIFKADFVILSNKQLPGNQIIISEKCFISMSDSIDNLNQYIPYQAAKTGITELEIRRSLKMIFIMPSMLNVSAIYKVCYSIYGLHKNLDHQ